MMLLKCYTQYISKFGKLSSGHRMGKGQFSLQSQRRSIPKNVQTTIKFCSFCTPIMCLCACSVVSDSVTPWTVEHQGPLSMGFSRQEYWNGLSFPTAGDLLDPGFEPMSPALLGRVFLLGSPLTLVRLCSVGDFWRLRVK